MFNDDDDEFAYIAKVVVAGIILAIPLTTLVFWFFAYYGME